MAQSTQNANALSFADDLIAFAQRVHDLIADAQDLQQRQQDKGYIANLQAMATYAVNPDGTQGATDGTPVAGNPIVGVNVSSYALDAFRTAVLNDLVTVLTGAGTVAQSDRRAQVQPLLP